MRLWTKQLDEDVHDASAAILSFGIAFRHQYLERGEVGKKMLEEIPNIFKRERRRDVIENGTGSKHFVIAVERMVLLLDEMEEALAAAPLARRRRLHLGRRGVHALPGAARASRHFGHGRRATSSRRLVPPLQGAAELPRCHRQVGECRLPCADEAARRRSLAAGAGDHAARFGPSGVAANAAGLSSLDADERTSHACAFAQLRAARLLLAVVAAGMAQPGVGADLSGAEHHLRGRLRGRRHRRRDRAAWSGRSSASGSSRPSWWRIAAAPAAISPPRP